MTPQELVQLIKQHERFVTGKPDGARANLQYQDLSGLRLPGLNLSHAVASGANFSTCQMMGTDFSHADLFATDFRDANLGEVNFDRADLRGADLSGANFESALLRGAIMTGVVLANTEMDSADLRDAKVTRGTTDLALEVQKVLSQHALWVESNGADGTRAELQEEDLSRLDLSGIYLNGADLRGCNFAHSNLSKGVFVLSDLSGANLEDVNAWRADFSGASLADACLQGPRLGYATFEPIELKGPDGKPLGRKAPSNLSRADLRNADFTGAELDRAVLKDADTAGAKIALKK